MDDFGLVLIDDQMVVVEDSQPRARVAMLLQHFSKLSDGREPQRVMYPLQEVLLLLTCATISSCDDFDDIAAWGKHHLGFLRRFSEFHFGIPCERWLRILVNRVDPILFGQCSKAGFTRSGPAATTSSPLSLGKLGMKGKTSRRTHDKRKGLKALHTLNAYATNARLTLAQLSVPEKTNEITAL